MSDNLPSPSNPAPRRWLLWLIPLAGILTAALLAALQSHLLWGNDWTQEKFYAPSFLGFLIPSLLAFGILALTNHWWLGGRERTAARRAAWLALTARLLCLFLVPLGLTFWGYAGAKTNGGILSTDALHAVQTAWADVQSQLPVDAVWTRSAGDNTGGLTVVGVIVYRLFSPDAGRPLLLELVAAIFSSLTVAAVYRLGELVFPRRVADIAAWIAALYPEAVLIGSSHLEVGYLAALLGLLLFAIAALFHHTSPQEDVTDLPPPPVCLLLGLLSVAGIYFISNQFFQLTLVIAPIALVWFSNPRILVERIIWIIGGLLLTAGLVLFVLNQCNLVPGHWDLISLEGKYLFGAAWSEYDKMAALGSQDMFMSSIASLPRSGAFVIAGFYGILQPALPAAIGYRNLTESGGAFWTILGICRGLGWYPALLVLLYAGLCACAGIRARKPETLMALLFWANAALASYRAFGDQWDNPRYRLFALVPMALLAAWGWVRFRQKNDIWFYRLLWPFVCSVTGLTVWYILRYYFKIKFPPVESLGVLVVLSLGVFFLMLLLPHLRRKKPAE